MKTKQNKRIKYPRTVRQFQKIYDNRNIQKRKKRRAK